MILGGQSWRTLTTLQGTADSDNDIPIEDLCFQKDGVQLVEVSV